MPDNLLYKYGSRCWVVIQASRARQFTSTCFGRAAGLMASNEDRLRRRRERDRLRRQTETAEEREARSINRLGHFGIYLCDVHSLELLNRLARRREYDRCRRAAITPEQHQQERLRLRQEMETDEERQSRLTANSVNEFPGVAFFYCTIAPL